ncbi:winged helix-turn-helix domain-containing protein, partial [Acinetobacter baumannii]
LEHLLRRKGHVVPKKLIADSRFGLDGELGSHAVEVYVHRRRTQLADCGAKVRVHTIRGVGYLMSEEP